MTSNLYFDYECARCHRRMVGVVGEPELECGTI